jgi:hypothetical protein
MKRYIFILSIMTTAILLCCSSQVQAEQEGVYTYTVTDGKAQITRYTGFGGVITIPNTLGGFPVTSIGSGAFFCALPFGLRSGPPPRRDSLPKLLLLVKRKVT